MSEYAIQLKVYDYKQWHFLLADKYQTLSPDEIRTAQKYKFETQQQRYEISRLLLRQHLSERLNVSTQSLRFEKSAYAKPYLMDHACYFNISHTQDFLCIASANVDIGVDIESAHNTNILDGAFHELLNTQQRAHLSTLAPIAQQQYMHDKWTQLESVSKCIGKGFFLDFNELNWVQDTHTHAVIEYQNQHYLSQHYAGLDSGALAQHSISICLHIS